MTHLMSGHALEQMTDSTYLIALQSGLASRKEQARPGHHGAYQLDMPALRAALMLVCCFCYTCFGLTFVRNLIQKTCYV